MCRVKVYSFQQMTLPSTALSLFSNCFDGVGMFESPVEQCSHGLFERQAQFGKRIFNPESPFGQDFASNETILFEASKALSQAFL